MIDDLDLPEIVTPRLNLTALSEVDAEYLRQLTDDPKILSAVHFLPNPFGIRASKALVRRGCSDRFFGGRLVADCMLTIVCGAHLRGDDTIEIGYWVGTAFSGAGLTYEATKALITR